MVEEQKQENGEQEVKQAPKPSPAHRQKVTFDLRFTLILIGTVAVFGVGVHFLHAFQVERNADTLLKKAHLALKEEKPGEAARYLRGYLGFRPNDAKAVAELAQLLDRQAKNGSQLQNAFFTYQEALRLDPGRNDLRLRSVEIALLLGRSKEALTDIKILQRESEDNLELSLLAAQCYLIEKRIDAASREYLAIVNVDATNVTAYQNLAALCESHYDELPNQHELKDKFSKLLVSVFPAKKIDELANDSDQKKLSPSGRIDLILNEMVRVGEPKYEALLARGRSLLSRNRIELAEADFTAASKLTDSSADLLELQIQLELKRVTAASELENSDQLQQHFDRIKSLSLAGLELPDSRPIFHFYLYQRAEGMKEVLKARKHLEEGLAAVEESLKVAELKDLGGLERLKSMFKMSYANVLITQFAEVDASSTQEALLKQANEIVDELRLKNLSQQSSDNNSSLFWQTEYLDGRLNLAREEWSLAIPKLERARTALSLNSEEGFRRQIDLSLGLCYQKLNNPDRRIVVFRRALEGDPFWRQARLELARALQAANRNDDAIQTYQLLGDVLGAPLEFARVLLLRELSKPKNQRNWEATHQALLTEEKLRVERKLPPSVDVDVLRIEILWQQGKQDEAKSLLADALKHFPDSPEIVSTQVVLLLADVDINIDQKFEQATQLLDDAEQKLGDSVTLRMARLNVIRKTNPEGSAEKVQLIAENIDQFNDSEKNQLLKSIAQTQLALGNKENAQQTLSKLSANALEPLLSRLTLIELAAKNKNEKRVSELLSEIREVEGPAGPYGNVVEVQQRLRKFLESKPEEIDPQALKSLNDSREMLKQAQRQRPSWVLATRLLGDIERLLSNDDVALEYYRKAIDQGDFSLEIVTFVVDSLYRQKNFKAADQVVQRVSKSKPELLTGNLARMAWRVAWQQQDYDQAVGLADKATNETRDYQDYIWLSRLRMAQEGEGESAEQPLLNAIQHFPKNPEVWIAYVSYLVRTDRLDDARKELTKAAEILPKEPASLIPLTLGRGYEILSDPKRAEAQYQLALNNDPENHSIHLQLAGFYVRNNEFQKADVHLAKLVDSQADVPENLRKLANRLRIETIAFAGSYADGERALKMLDDSKADQEPLTLTDLRVKVQILGRRSTKHDQQELLKVFTAIDDRNAATATERFQLAKLHAGLGNWNESKRRYQSLLEDEPELKNVMIAFADALLTHNETEEARKWIELAKSGVANSLLMQLIEIRLIDAEQGGDAAFKEMLTYLEQDLALNDAEQVAKDLLSNSNGRQLLDELKKNVIAPNSKLAETMNRGLRQLQNGQNALAIETLASVVENKQLQDHIKAFYYRSASKLLIELEQPNAAEELWRKALELSYREQDLIRLITFVGQQSRVTEALDLCEEKLWGKFPDGQAAQTTIAILRAGEPTTKELQRAEALISNAIRKTPSSLLKRYLADLKDLSGQHEQSIQLYHQVLNENKKDLIALNNMAFLSALIGQDLKLSIDSINTAIELAGPISALLDTRGVVHLKRKEYKQAIADLERANDETPSAPTLFRLSQAYWESGNIAAAKQALKEARDAGLSKQSVHPLELDEYEKHIKKLDNHS